MNTTYAANVTGQPLSLTPLAMSRACALKFHRSRAAAPSHAPGVLLAQRETFWVDHLIGCEVSCHDGEIGLAVDYHPQAVVLAAVQSYRCTADARPSVHAMRPSRFRLQ